MYRKSQVYPAAQDCASPAGLLPNVMQFTDHPDIAPFSAFVVSFESSIIQIERNDTYEPDGGVGVPDLMITKTLPGRLSSYHDYYVCDTTSGYCVALVLFAQYFVDGKKIASEVSETFLFWTKEQDSIREYMRKFVGRFDHPKYVEDISAWWTVFDLETRHVVQIDEMSVALT